MNRSEPNDAIATESPSLLPWGGQATLWLLLFVVTLLVLALLAGDLRGFMSR